MSEQVMLGVAIAIPQPYATVLTNWRKRVGDPAAERVWPHVTLLPPTPVDTAAMPAIEHHLTRATQACRPFVMHLSGTGTFRPTSPVVFVQVSCGVAECVELESQIRRGPLSRALDFPYHPHVTIAQHVDDSALDEAGTGLSDFVARFPVDHIVLFSRDPDRSWHWRTEFTLGGAAALVR